MPTSLSPAPSSAKAAKQKTGCMTKTDFSPMKKIFALAGLVTAAVISLTNCQPKELGTDVPAAGKTVLIKASMDADTKTTADGMSTLWAEGDKINLFYGSSYTSLGEVTIADGVGTKQATFQVTDAPSGSVKWYAIYPYSSKLETPAEQTASYTYIGNRNGLTQDGFDNTGALCGTACPLYGIAEGTAEEVNISMKHLSSAIELNLTNNTGKEIIVNKVTVTASEDIVGSYYIAFASGTPEYTPSEGYVNSSAVVNLEDSTLGNGESGKVYLAVKPFTQSSSEPFTVKINATVNGDPAETTIELHPSGAQCVFTAGKMKQVNVNIASIDVAGGNTVAESQAAVGSYTLKKVQITSIVGNNILVTDNTGTVLVYASSASGFAVGDYVSVVGTTKAWNNLMEFDKPTITKVSSGSVSLTPTTWSDAQMAAAYGNAQVKYVTYQATFTKDRNATIPNSEAILYTTNATGITQTAGSTYKVTGYVYGWTDYTPKGSTTTTKEVCMFVDECEEVSAAPTETQVVFDFNEGLSDMGLSAPAAGDPGLAVDSFSQDGVTIKAYNSFNNTPVRVYLGTGADPKTTLRTYNGTALVIIAPSGKNITKVSSVSNSTSTLEEGQKCAAVTLYCTGSATINKITVTLDDDTVVPGIGGAVSLAETQSNTVSILMGGYSSAPNTSISCDNTVVSSASVSNKTKDSMTLTYQVKTNNTSDSREGWVKITSGSAVATVKVTQPGIVFSTTKTEVVLDAAAGSHASFTVKSDADWTAQLSGSGFNVSPESFEFDGESVSQSVTVTATDANTTTSDKTLGTISFKRSDATLQVTVVQKSSKLEAPTITLNPNGSAKTITASWDAIPNAVGYKYKISSESSYSETTETSVTFTGLTVGTTYTVSVIALGDNDPYVDSDEATAQVKLTSASVKTVTLSGTLTKTGDGVYSLTTSEGIKVTQRQNDGNAVNEGSLDVNSLRVYVKNSLEFSGKTITKIEFTNTAGYAGGTGTTVNTGTWTRQANCIWEGSSNNIVITNVRGDSDTSNIQFRPTAIKVTYQE